MKGKVVLMIALFLAQLTVPALMIYQQKMIKSEGTTYRFKCRPVDPSDPFRGRYIDLAYDNEIVRIAQNKEQMYDGQEVYCTLMIDDQGYAKIARVYTQAPEEEAYFNARIKYLSKSEDETTLTLDLPIDHYYMNEYKAPQAEKNYDEAMSNKEEIYAIVKVFKGSISLEKVMIGDVRIEEYGE